MKTTTTKWVLEQGLNLVCINNYFYGSMLRNQNFELAEMEENDYLRDLKIVEPNNKYLFIQLTMDVNGICTFLLSGLSVDNITGHRRIHIETLVEELNKAKKELEGNWHKQRTKKIQGCQ